MSDHKTCRLRVVAYKTEEWTSVDRPPLTELVHCDLVVPDIMLLFAENHLRLGAMESNTYFPRIAFVAALDETVFHIGETSPNLASAIHDDSRPDYIIAHGTAGLRMLMAPISG